MNRRHRTLPLVGVCALSMLLQGVVALPAAAAVGTIVEFNIPSVNTVPEGITVGPDGNLWFTEAHSFGPGGHIGRMTPAGVATEFALPTSQSGPFWITAAPDGNLWFTESSANQIGRISTSGAVTEFPVPTAFSGPDQITVGPDGNLWFTEFNSNVIAKIDMSGAVTEVAHLATGSGPTGIAVGPDGNLWFDEQSGDRIGKITAAGVVTEVATLTTGDTPSSIATGPDGNLWFTEFYGNRIGMITTAGVVTEFAVPTANSHPGTITAGPDGNLWFTEQNGNMIARITPAGVVTEFGPVPTSGSGPGGITTGPDGNMWFTERFGNKLGRLALTVPATCDETWVGGVDNSFGTAGNWSGAHVPGSTEIACINATTTTSPAAAADTYTVVANGPFAVAALYLGGPNGTQTLVLSSGSTFFASTAINTNGVLNVGDAGPGDTLLGLESQGLFNAGHLNFVSGGGGIRNFTVNVINAVGGTIDVAGDTAQAGGLCGNSGRGTINNGAFIVEATGHFVVGCGAFTNAGGNVANNGSFRVTNGRFFQRAGSESGNPVVITNGSILDDDTSAGAGFFTISGQPNPSTGNVNSLIGSGASPGVARGQVVTIASDTFIEISNLTNAGTITLGDAGPGDSTLCCLPALLTNTGVLSTVQGGVRHLQVDINNALSGTIDIAALTGQDSGCAARGNTTLTNNGTFTVEAVGAYTVACDFFANIGGSLTNNGGFGVTGGRFTQRGGLESGNPVFLVNGSTLDDDTSAAAGFFTLEGPPNPSTGNANSLIGTGSSPGVAAGQVVTLGSKDSFVTIYNLINAGTINLGDAAGGDTTLCCQPATLANIGTLRTVQGGGGTRHIQVIVLNDAGGIIDIASANSVHDGTCGGVGDTNNGMFGVEAGAAYVAACAFVQGGGGTFATTIDANTTSFGVMTGAGVGLISLAGNLLVTTVGSPAAGSTWPIITGGTPLVGQFSTLHSGSTLYDVQYPLGGVTLVVLAQAKTDQTITFGALANKTFGDPPFTVSATATSGLAVSFAASGACTVAGSTVTITGAGSCTITASQAGDANFNPALDVSQGFSIGKANQTISFGALATKTFGDPPFLVSATASSGLAVSFAAVGNCTIAGSTLTITGAGSCTITASQAGDANFNPAADVPQSFNIGKSNQTITFGALASKTFGDPPFLVSATASSGLAVSFAALGNCTIAGSTVTITGAGSCTIAASQAGNANFNPAPDVPQSFGISKANQTITFGALPNKTFGDLDFTVAATSSSGLTVGFTTSGSCSVSGTTVHITGAGSCTITASQAGNANFNPAPDVPQTFSIAKASQTITFGALPNKTFGDPDFTVGATSSSGLTVSFTASGSCSVSGSTVHITGAGSCTITASQAGNANYNAATPVAQTFSIAAAGTTVTEHVIGIETGFPTSCAGGSLSSFVGLASGTLRGFWSAAICHTPLVGSATILGGSFVLQSRTATVRGSFTGGTVVFVGEFDSFGLCIQTYKVSGTLTDGTFDAVLTHYGVRTASGCRVFFATINGTATLTF